MARRPPARRPARNGKKGFNILCVCDQGVARSPAVAKHVVKALTGEDADFSMGREPDGFFRTKDGRPFLISVRGIDTMPRDRARAMVRDGHIESAEAVELSFIRRLGRADLEHADVVLSSTELTDEGHGGRLWHARPELPRILSALRHRGAILNGEEIRGLPHEEVKKRLLRLLGRAPKSS